MPEIVEKNNHRQSNFEIIRIIAMIMILASHYVQHGLSQAENNAGAFYTVLSHFLGSGGKVGVSLFFLITGYFMIDKQLHLKSMTKIIINTLFYSWIIMTAFVLCLPNEITMIKIYKSILPVSTGQYWFVTTYIIVYLLSPILNIIINSLEKNKLDFYLSLLFLLWFIIQPLTYKIHFSYELTLGCMYVYCIGAYIKKYGIKFFDKKINRLYTYFISMIFVICWLIICNYFNINNRNWWHHLSFLNSCFVLCPAISVFYYFKNIKIEYNKWINYLASSAFSVYLITENIWMRKFIWTKIFHCCHSSSITYLLFNIIITVFLSYILCVIIDKLANTLLLNKIYNFTFNKKLFKTIENKLASL